MSSKTNGPASFGGRATEGAFRDRAAYGQPAFAKKEPMSPRSRALLGAVILLAIVGLGSAASSLDWERIYRGEGYVPWRLTQKHAVADCRKYGKHLVLLTVDPQNPANDSFRRRVLVDAEVQRLSSGFVWWEKELSPGEVANLRADQEDPKAPLAPTVAVVAWDLENVLAGPEDATTISAGGFLKMMRTALEIDADPGQVDSP